jgi:surface antigen
MSFPRGGRRPRRVIGGTIVVAAAAMGVMSLAPASHADDDYPYRGLGHCPLVPLKPSHHHGDPTKPGHHQDGPGRPTPTGPGHHGTKPGKPGHDASPPRQCAKNIWFYQGTYGDPWGFALRNCTSFVAWRLRETNGMTDFTSNLDGGSFGDADNWDDNAKALGYLVDGVPAVGSVAQSDDGHAGHVAWVESVGDGTVTVEEYNLEIPGGYDVRTVPTADFRYLHLDDISPAASQGTARATVSTLDAQGRTWSARTTADGTLMVGGALRRPARLGLAGSWTPDAAPGLATDARGHTWVAAVTGSGELMTAHTTGGGTHWSRPRSLGSGWSTTASPSLARDGQGRLHLIAVTGTGRLVELWTKDLHWRHGTRMGQAGSWATHTSPTVVDDAQGRLWLAAVTGKGALEVRHQRTTARWSRFTALGDGWSVSSTPALASTDGRVWLAGISDHGRLSVQSTTGTGGWDTAASTTGTWSPYSSPALSADSSGRLWLAAEHADGRVVVVATRPHSVEWQSESVLGPAGVTGSTTITPLAVGGVRVGALSGSDAERWWTQGLPATTMAGAPGAHGGGFSASLQLRMP